MKLPTRRMTFQLTPLLDLLLIVIFAQFIEVRDTTTKSEAVLERQKSEAQQQIEEKAKKLREQMDAEHADRMTQLLEKEKSLIAQREQVGDVLSEAFNMSDKAFERVLQANSANTYSTEQKQQMARALRALRSSKGRQLLKMLVSYGEMQKRCDIWEVHVEGNELIQFSAGDTTTNIRADTKDEITDGLFKAYKTLPEPKTLVIILFSYGNTNAGARRRAEEALPDAIAKMRADTGQRNWFEFAILGFAPEGPSLQNGKR